MNFLTLLASDPVIPFLGRTYDISLNWLGQLIRILIEGIGIVGVGIIGVFHHFENDCSPLRYLSEGDYAQAEHQDERKQGKNGETAKAVRQRQGDV